MMNPLYVLIPVLVVLAGVAYGVIRALGRIWLDHRIRLTLLERIQEKPELLGSYNELQSALAEIPNGRRHGPRQNYAVTGILLALIGIGCAMLGRYWRVGAAAVGLHLGGWICIGLGLILFTLGLLIRWLSRNPVAAAQ